MRKHREKIPILDFIKIQSSTYEDILRDLITHITKVPHPKYNSAAIYHAELLHRNSENMKIISSIKEVQWKIVNYSILLDAALLGISKLIDLPSQSQKWKIVASIVLLLLYSLVTFAAYMMIQKTEGDLHYYREHGKLNEHLLNETTGMNRRANQIVVKSNPHVFFKPDYFSRALQSYLVFTLWFYIIIIFSGILSFAAALFLMWI